MNEKEINTNPPNDTSSSPRPWIEPTFERVRLHDAMSGSGAFTLSDSSTYGS